MWTTLHSEGRSKTNKKKKKKERKKETENICKGTPDIEFEQDWSVGLDTTLRERQKIKNYISSFKDFSGENSLVSHCWVLNVLLIHKI